MLDAALLTLVLASVVWRGFLVPLQRLHDDRGRLLERTLSAQETGRTRIARDLHDGLGQNLTSMLLHLRVIEETPTIDSAREHVGTVRRIAAMSLDDQRATHPPALDDLGSPAALEKQLADIAEISGLAATFVCDGKGIGPRNPGRSTPPRATSCDRAAPPFSTAVNRAGRSPH